MTHDIASYIMQSDGEYDQSLLSETGSGGLLSDGYVSGPPIADRLDAQEIPHYVIATTSEPPTVRGLPVTAPSSLNGYRAFLVVTERRLLLVVGRQGDDFEYTVPLEHVDTASTTSQRGLIRRTPVIDILTRDDGEIRIIASEGSDPSRVATYITRQAEQRREEQRSSAAGDETGAETDATDSGDTSSDKSRNEQENATDSEGTDSPARADLIAELQRINDQTDRVLKAPDLNQHGEYGRSQYYSAFGSLEEALEATGIDRREQCLDEIDVVVWKLGRLPNQADIERLGRVSGPFIAKHFETWTAALEAYLDRENLTGESAPDDLLLGEIHRLGKKQPGPVMPGHLADDGAFDPSVYETRFGSWPDALAAAGIDVEQELLDSINRLSERYEVTVTPAHLGQTDRLDTQVVVEVFGSLEAAISAARSGTDSDPDSGDTQTGTQPDDGTDRTDQPVPSSEWSDEAADIIRAIQRVNEQVTGPIKASDFIQKTEYQRADYRAVFDDWESALAAAGISRREQLFEELDRLRTDLGTIPGSAQFNREASVSNGLVYNEFDTWDTFIDAYQEWDESSVDQSADEIPERDTPDLSEAIRQVADNIDHPIRTIDLEEQTDFNRNAFMDEFDSWDDAVEAAGIDRRQRLLDELHRVADRVDGVPKQPDVHAHGRVSPSVFVNYFGSWSDARAAYRDAFGHHDSSDEDQQEPVADEYDELFTEFHEIAQRMGHPPTYWEFDARADVTAGHLTSRIGSWDEVIATYEEWAMRTDRTPVSEGAEMPDGATTSVDAKAPSPGLVTTLPEVPANKRFSERLPLKVIDISSGGDRVDARVDVVDAAQNTAHVNVWAKHDIEHDWTVGEWYELSEVRIKRWMKNGSERTAVSSTRDLQIQPHTTEEKGDEKGIPSDDAGGVLAEIEKEFDTL